MKRKPGLKINEWLIRESSEHIDTDHFRETCKRLYTALLSFPLPVFSDWKENQFYFSVGKKYCYIPYNPEICEYDFPEFVRRWLYKYFPGYSVDLNFERPYTAQEIAELITQGADPDTVFNSKYVGVKKERFKIEKLVIRDDQVSVKINKKRFILMSRANMPLSIFISNFRKIESDWEKKAFVERFTKKILEVTYHKSVEIKYTGKTLENFFKVRLVFLIDKPFIQSDNKLIYKWDRFIIYFSNEAQAEKCKQILEFFKKEYHHKKNYEVYFKKEFNIRIGEQS